MSINTVEIKHEIGSGMDRQYSWRPLRISIYYRIIVSIILLVLGLVLPAKASAPIPVMTGIWISIVYLVYSLAAIPFFVWEKPSFRTQVNIHATADITFLSLLMYAFGSTVGGLGLLMVVAVTGASILSHLKTSIAFAAYGAITILLMQGYAALYGFDIDSQSITQSGLLGAVLFIAAIAGHSLAKQIREQAEIARKRGYTIENLEKINAFIVQHLPSGILVVSANDSIIVINESAKLLLNVQPYQLTNKLIDISPELFEQKESWRQTDNFESRQFSSPDGSHTLQATFDAIGNDKLGTTIISLDDTDALSDKVQQAKLASLGRLTASIAHEIRNPLGAIGHAGQLLSESSHLDTTDNRMTQIIQDNTRRVNQIIENILQLSRRDKVQGQQVLLADWLNEFIDNFLTNHGLPEETIVLETTSDSLSAWVDPMHLQQIFWNLTENALKYGKPREGAAEVKLFLSREESSKHVFIEIKDNGAGIPASLSDTIFEPFYTTHTSGTGLGLYICRELAELNKCRLKYISDQGGACFRMTFTHSR